MKQNRFHWFNPTGVAYTEPVEDETPQMPESHPSYGTLSVTKVSSSGTLPCFGSPILLSQTIHVCLLAARLKRTMHEDRISPDKELFRVEMTPQQFADMLTSPNSGSGTPVTIRRILGEQIGETPFVSKRTQFQEELKHEIKKINEKAKTTSEDIAELVGRSNLPKKEKEYILHLIRMLHQDVESNLPFLTTQMGEEMDRVVGEAKASINSYLNDQAQARNIPLAESAPILQLEAGTQLERS